jgi:hypothetical protein
MDVKLAYSPDKTYVRSYKIGSNVLCDAPLLVILA